MAGYGGFGHVGLKKEVTWGTPVAVDNYVPFISESMVKDIEQLMDPEVRAYRDEPPQYPGIVQVKGDLVFAVRPATIGYFLRSCLGAPTTTGSTNYTHAFLPAASAFQAECFLPSYTYEIHRDLASAFQYAGCVVDSLQLEMGVGQKIMRCTASILGKKVTLISKTTPTLDATDPFLWSQASTTIGGGAVSQVESFSVKFSNNLEGIVTLNGSNELGAIGLNGPLNCDINMTINCLDLTEYNRYIAQSLNAMVLTVTKDVNTEIKIETAKMLYTAFPVNVGGPQRLSVAVTGKAKYDASLGGALKVTLKNQVASY